MKYLSVVAIIVCLFITSCKKEEPVVETCPAYNPSLLNKWFPYDKGDKYVFTDTAGNEYYMNIDDVKYSTGETNANGECVVYGLIYAHAPSLAKDEVDLGIEHYSSYTNGQNLTLTLEGNQFLMNGTSSGNLQVHKTHTAVSHATIMLNDKPYTNVFELHDGIPRNSDDVVTELYFAKGIGVIGYAIEGGRTHWLK